MHPTICCTHTHAHEWYMHIRAERKRGATKENTLGANRCWGHAQNNTATSMPRATPAGPRQILVGGA
eukprot:8158177-Lingulodinium_polyedra.AAC.1